MDTSLYVGEINVLCIANHVYDLVIGNIQEAKPADKLDLTWGTRKESEIDINQVSAVEICAQSPAKGKTIPLTTQKSIRDFSKSDIMKSQMADES